MDLVSRVALPPMAFTPWQPWMLPAMDWCGARLDSRVLRMCLSGLPCCAGAAACVAGAYCWAQPLAFGPGGPLGIKAACISSYHQYMAHWLPPTCLDHERTSKVAVCAAATAAAKSDSLPDLQAKEHLSCHAHFNAISFGAAAEQVAQPGPGCMAA